MRTRSTHRCIQATVSEVRRGPVPLSSTRYATPPHSPASKETRGLSLLLGRPDPPFPQLVARRIRLHADLPDLLKVCAYPEEARLLRDAPFLEIKEPLTLPYQPYPISAAAIYLPRSAISLRTHSRPAARTLSPYWRTWPPSALPSSLLEPTSRPRSLPIPPRSRSTEHSNSTSTVSESTAVSSRTSRTGPAC